MKDIRFTIWFYYLLLVVGMATLLMCTGCCPKTYEHIVRDTVTVERIDTVIVNMREVDVSLPVPQIELSEKIPLCDTLLVLDNGLYKSEVEVKDGQIKHSLKPSENADSLHGTAIVADTTHIHQTETTISHTEKEKTVVKKEESWWSKLKQNTWIALTFIVLIIFILSFRVVKRH